MSLPSYFLLGVRCVIYQPRESLFWVDSKCNWSARMPQSYNLEILLLLSFILFNLFLSSMLILGVEQFVQALSEILCKSIRPFLFGPISSFLGETCVLARALQFVFSVLRPVCSCLLPGWIAWLGTSRHTFDTLYVRPVDLTHWQICSGLTCWNYSF